MPTGEYNYIDESAMNGGGHSGRNRSSFLFRPRRALVNPVLEKEKEQEKFLEMQKEVKAHYNNILRGNNSELVRRCMETRHHWEETSASNTLFNFKWQPVAKGLKFD